MVLRPGVCDTGRPVVGEQPAHLRRQKREADSSIRVVLFTCEHTRGEGAMKAIDGGSEFGGVGVFDNYGDGAEALLDQPAAVLQSLDRRLKDRSRRPPALNGRLDELNNASTGESKLLESFSCRSCDCRGQHDWLGRSLSQRAADGFGCRCSSWS